MTNTDTLSNVATLQRRTRSTIIVGAVVISSFVLTFVLWAAFVPLQGGVVAAGTIRALGKTRSLQHLEGGIVAAIHVHDGQRVEAGDRIITLRTIDACSNTEKLRKVLAAFRVREARLMAEQEGRTQIQLSADLQQMPDIDYHLDVQSALLIARRSALTSQLQVLQERRRQLRLSLAALGERRINLQRQFDLVKQEETDKQTLLVKGLARKPDALRLRRMLVELEGRLSETEAQQMRTKGEISELDARVAAVTSQSASEIAEQIADVRTRLASFEEDMRRSSDQLMRTDVIAPVDGIVTNLKVTTIGGVVGAGDNVADIVPVREAYIIEAQIPIDDVDSIREGQDVVVTLPGLGGMNAERLAGRVRHVSADRLQPNEVSPPHYVATVEFRPDGEKATMQMARLRSGMSARVLIVTELRTAGRYLLDPFHNALDRALREPVIR